MKFISILIVSMFFSSVLKASELVICNQCDSAGEMYSKAYYKVKRAAELSYTNVNKKITVVNIPRNQVSSYYFSARWIMQLEDEPELIIRRNFSTPPQHIVQTVNKLHKDPLIKKLTRGFDVPKESHVESAWDVARDSTRRAYVDQWIFDNHSFQYFYSHMMNLTGYLGITMVEGIHVKVNFSDGSSAKFIPSNLKTGDFKLSYVPHSAVDADGNYIPDQGFNFSGTYSFTTKERLQAYAKQLDMYRVRYKIISNRWGGRYRYSIVVTVLR